MTIDIHVNLLQFPTSRSSSTVIHCSIEETANFLKNNNIDCAVVLYPRDDYFSLETLQKLTPNTKIMGLQVLMGVDEADRTDINNLSLDVCDPSKSFTHGNLCYGIKIASHRGWWLRDNQVVSGLDYAKENRLISKWISQIPDDSIVSFHTQGDPIFSSSSNPTTVSMFAERFPYKKFIINHCGDFGQSGLSNKPKEYWYEKYQTFPAFRHAHHKALVSASVAYANGLHNILLDTSVHTPFKGKALKSCKSWCVGSDYPFQVKGNKSNSQLFIKEYNKFVADVGEDFLKQANNRAFYWLQTPTKILLEEFKQQY